MPDSRRLVDTALLALFSAPDADHCAAMAALGAEDWSALLARATAQRGETLLRRALQRAGAGLPVPAHIRAALTEAVRDRTVAALKQAEALRRVARVLHGAGLDPIALKGVRLAWRVYPAPALRPMRDLDLLLPPGEVERAQALLLARPEYTSPEWAGRYGPEYGHQLPEIIDLETGVMIELHHRLNARGWSQESRLIELMTSTSEIVAVGGGSIRVPSAHANVLHLIEHATLHHLFDNGPAVLADLHFSAEREPIDWPLLRSQADVMGLGRSLSLIAAVAARHGARWPAIAGLAYASDVGADQLAAAEAALLREREAREQVAFLRRLETRVGVAPGLRAGIRAALSPGAAALAQVAGTHSSDWRRWFAYPQWLARRIAYYGSTRGGEHSRESSRMVRLLEWLHGQPNV